MVSARVDRLEPSATLELADKANELRREGKDVISLSVGEPDYPTPEFVKDAAREALDDDFTGYTDTAGIHELRGAVAEKYRRDNSIDATSDDVLITPGAKFALFLAFQSVVDPGEPVVLIDPSWVSFEAMGRLLDAEIRRCPVDDRLLPDTEAFKEKIEGASLAVINSPCNPTGAVYPEERVRAMAESAQDAGATVVSDEVYERIVYEGRTYSPGSDYENVVTVNGLSKSFSMTGWRLGYVHGPDEIVDGMLKLQSHSVTCANSFAQRGALAALQQRERAEAAVEKMREGFRRRRDLLVDELNDVENVDCVTPQGAFYAFPRVDCDMDSFELSEELLQNGVAVTPGAAFGPGGDGHLRVSYAVSEDQLHEAVRRMTSVIEDL